MGIKLQEASFENRMLAVGGSLASYELLLFVPQPLVGCFERQANVLTQQLNSGFSLVIRQILV